MESSIDLNLAQRLKAARAGRGWKLEQFAETSGVSRAMISKIERGEVSPTATILGRLAVGLGVTLASLFSDRAEGASPLARRAEQPIWNDPATDYQRRAVSPPGAQNAAEIVDVNLPPGARVMFDNALGWQGIVQQVWLLSGVLEMTVGAETTELCPGDCLFMKLDQPLVFHNRGKAAARYAVILSRVSL